MSNKDYYAILEVEKTATIEIIKKSYRKLAMQYHPDRNGWDKEAEKKFKEINEAYSVLSDDSKRKQYDTFWTVWWNWFSWWFWVDFDISDIFDQFFGWGFSSWRTRKKQTSFRWEDLEHIMKIDLETSIYGWKQKIKIDKFETCNDCKWEWWEWKKSCDKCSWTWYVKYRQQSMFWTIEHTWACDNCDWTWEIIEKVCETCKAKKRIKKQTELEIDIPAWIDDGMIIKLNEEWNDWINSKAKWDLYIKFKVNLEEKWLKRDSVNLYYNLEIDVVEAILWTKKEINIPIIWKRTIKIESGTQVWTVLKLSSDWVKYIDRDSKWDLFINLEIKIPKKLGKIEKESYINIAKEKKLDVWWKWFLDKLF